MSERAPLPPLTAEQRRALLDWSEEAQMGESLPITESDALAHGQRIGDAIDIKAIVAHGSGCLCLVCDAFRECAHIARSLRD